MDSYQPLNTLDITIIEKKFLPLNPRFLHPLPHVGGSLPAPVPMDVGHLVTSPELHQGEEGERRPNSTVEEVVEGCRERYFLGTSKLSWQTSCR